MEANDTIGDRHAAAEADEGHSRLHQELFCPPFEIPLSDREVFCEGEETNSMKGGTYCQVDLSGKEGQG